jgi:hypothetical protein
MESDVKVSKKSMFMISAWRRADLATLEPGILFPIGLVDVKSF